MRHRTLLGISLAGTIAVLLASCTQPPPGGTSPAPTTTTTTQPGNPTAPRIDSFTVKGSPGPAPALATLAWQLSAAAPDSLTCRLDGDGDGTFEVTIPGCGRAGTRNVSIPSPRSVTAVLEVDDGTHPPVRASRSFNVPAGASEPFDIELRGLEDLDADVAAAFTDAAARWEEVIVRGLPDFSSSSQPNCLPSDVAPLPTDGTGRVVVDDLIVDVSVVPIDGPGKVLGRAGPTCVLLGTELAFHGIMEFDSADVAIMRAEGILGDVIEHELGHVLGIGTLWDMSWAGAGTSRRLLKGAGSSDPTFVGAAAVAELSVLGRAGDVPVEAGGGSGTRDAHWRESTFGNELMTGYVNRGLNPLSRMTIASLADMGYRVDLDRADTYQLPFLPAMRGQSTADDGVVLRPPVGLA